MSQEDDMPDAAAAAAPGTDAGRQELQDLRERMSAIKAEVAADVESKWTTPWRTPDVFDLKVQTRLSSHSEYRSLRERAQKVEASLAANPGTT